MRRASIARNSAHRAGFRLDCRLGLPMFHLRCKPAIATAQQLAAPRRLIEELPDPADHVGTVSPDALVVRDLDLHFGLRLLSAGRICMTLSRFALAGILGR